MWFLRFLLTIVTFILTMLLALFAFSYTLINYPSTMRELQRTALYFREQIHGASLPDNYMVWLDVFFQENQIVLVGFSIVMRILISIVFGILGLIFGSRRSSSAGASTASSSPFSRWG
jgi:hypothetical protein